MTRTIRVWKHGDAYWILYTPRAGLMSASKTEGIATLRR